MLGLPVFEPPSFSPILWVSKNILGNSTKRFAIAYNVIMKSRLPGKINMVDPNNPAGNLHSKILNSTMTKDYQSLKISRQQGAEIANQLYGIAGDVTPLPGELDFNFKIDAGDKSYLLKVSRPHADQEFLEFQLQLLHALAKNTTDINISIVYPDIRGNTLGQFVDQSGTTRFTRLLSWIDGRLWSSVNPQTEKLLESLGEKAGALTTALQNFDHPQAHRTFEWDVAQAAWTRQHLNLFDKQSQALVQYFQQRFEDIQNPFKQLRKSVVHNDLNDNNIVVSSDLIDPLVESIIDFGDAVYTQTINDLAITLAYAVMNKADALSAATAVVRGYHRQFPLQQDELPLVYVLVAVRLIITVTKSAINKQREPENEYLLVSEAPAWKALQSWREINENFAHYRFREACGYQAHPDENRFRRWAEKYPVSLKSLFPGLSFDRVQSVDMSVSSTWLGHESEFSDLELSQFKLRGLQRENPDSLIAGGYLETRPFYSTDAFRTEGNNGRQYRSVHLGIDFWVAPQTAIHALFDGTVISLFDNDYEKDYGPTLILQHQPEHGPNFYTLYGHLSKSSLDLLHKGQSVAKGDLIGFIGDANENGGWVPHLHFQVMLDLLGNTHNFPGVGLPQEIDVWKGICPDPGWFFGHPIRSANREKKREKMIAYRRRHLGKSLSLSYQRPLHIVRGSGAFLMDKSGRKYLDTINNVAHVGHEHPRVVAAGQRQMALLNTNTRYLHRNIIDFTSELLATFPVELSVVHFVNSGSEANELALRMARACTGQRDMIAVEVGYHGNTGACVDVSSYKFDGKGGKGAPEFTHIVPLPDRFRGLYRGDATGALYAAHITDQIRSIQSSRRNVAAFICESIISCGGQIELPNDYLKLAYAAVREAGGVCIADEVQVGCGRVGHHFWGFQLQEVTPDIVTIGKPIGNGHPLAAVVCTQEVAEAFANGMEYFNTFGGNPVSCAIGLEVLKVIKDENLQGHALEVGSYLKSGLTRLQVDFPIIGDVRGQGLFIGFELVNEDKKPLAEKATYLANRMKEFGILMSTDGRDNNVLKIKPPMVFSRENADELLFRLAAVFKEDFMSR